MSKKKKKNFNSGVPKIFLLVGVISAGIATVIFLYLYLILKQPDKETEEIDDNEDLEPEIDDTEAATKE